MSGFIITRVIDRKNALEFVVDRFTRIYPIYWLALLPMVFLYWDGDASHLLSSATLTPFFGHIGQSYLGVGWTLYFEILFYAAAALTFLGRRTVTPILVGCWLVALGASRVIESPILHFIGNSMILEFLFGVVIARLPMTDMRKTGLAVAVIGLAAMVLFTSPTFGFIENMLNGVAFSRGLVWGLPAAAITWGALQWDRWLQRPYIRLLSFGGDAPYSIYLSHPVFLLAKPSNPYFILFFGTPVLIGLRLIVHQLIEKPLLRKVRHLMSLRAT